MARYVLRSVYLGLGKYTCPFAVRAAHEQLPKRRQLDKKQGKYDTSKYKVAVPSGPWRKGDTAQTSILHKNPAACLTIAGKYLHTIP